MVTIDSSHVKSGATCRRILALLSAALITAGCSSITDHFPRYLRPYRPDVQQGNVITSDMVDQLRAGMSRDQVKFMLGTPLLVDGFHPDRWDYLYYLNPRSGAPQRRNLVIFFKDNRLESFKSDPMPPESMADNLILGRKGPMPVFAAPKELAAPATETPKGPSPEVTPPGESPKEGPEQAAPASGSSGQTPAPVTPGAGVPSKEAAPTAEPSKEAAPAGEAPMEAAPPAPAGEAPEQAAPQAPADEAPKEAAPQAPAGEAPMEAAPQAPTSAAPMETAPQAPSAEAPKEEAPAATPAEGTPAEPESMQPAPAAPEQPVTAPAPAQ